uniref:Uncharacterized protein n=1 Tax=Urocitellus parryii TaxID=9999 RepID=A0A8D2GJD8_UROPR
MLAAPCRRALRMLLASQAMALRKCLEADDVLEEWLLQHVVQGGKLQRPKAAPRGEDGPEDAEALSRADLHVSDSTLHPSFHDYGLQPATCARTGPSSQHTSSAPWGGGSLDTRLTTRATSRWRCISTGRSNRTHLVRPLTPQTVQKWVRSMLRLQRRHHKESLLWTTLISILKLVLGVLF